MRTKTFSQSCDQGLCISIKRDDYVKKKWSILGRLHGLDRSPEKDSPVGSLRWTVIV